MALSAVFARGARQHVGMFCRNLSGDVTKEKLLALRRQTGLGLDKCRAALVDKSGSVEEAAAFLKEEAKKHGWARMEKLGARQSAQGLLGVIQTGDDAVSIVEVTCETDFVQRNDRFVELVHNAARTFHTHSRSLLPGGAAFGVEKYGFEKLRDMPLENSSTSLGDHLAEAVGIIGENIVIRQGVAIASPLLAAYAHSVGVAARDGCQFCHICAIADLQTVTADQAYGDSQKQAARQVCQHLLSMNPSNPGLEATSRPYNLDNVREVHKATLAESFVLDESKTVGEVLDDSGLALGGFVRVQLGQETE